MLLEIILEQMVGVMRYMIVATAKQAKAKYAIGVAEKIVSVSDESRRIPPKINSLLDAMSPIMSNEGEFHYATITETTTNSQS